MVSLKKIDADWANDQRFGGAVYEILLDGVGIGATWRTPGGEYSFYKHSTATAKLTAGLMREIAAILEKENVVD